VKRSLWNAIWLMVFAVLGTAQSSAPISPETIEPPEDIAVISYTFDFDELNPSHFEITLDASGKGSYQAQYSEVSLEVGQPLTYQKAIQLEPATMKKILAKIVALDYLKGNYDYTKQRIAFTGKKTLTYKDNTHRGSTTLNWSENKGVMELVDTFQGIQSTFELGRRLEYFYKHQKLGLFDEMKYAEDAAQNGWLHELYLIRDILQKLNNDPKVIQSVRNGAKRLMDRSVMAP